MYIATQDSIPDYLYACTYFIVIIASILCGETRYDVYYEEVREYEYTIYTPSRDNQSLEYTALLLRDDGWWFLVPS